MGQRNTTVTLAPASAPGTDLDEGIQIFAPEYLHGPVIIMKNNDERSASEILPKSGVSLDLVDEIHRETYIRILFHPPPSGSNVIYLRGCPFGGVNGLTNRSSELMFCQ